MFDHIGIFVSDFEKSIPFYEACLAPLGITIIERQPELGAVIFSGEENIPFLWVGTASGDYYGNNLQPDIHRPMHLSFKAPSEQVVKDFFRMGLKHGGRDNGEPEDCGGDYFAAYLLDPDGNNIEAGIRII